MLGAALAVNLTLACVPLVLAIVAQRRWRTRWSLFGAGAVAFVASKVVQLPLAAAVSRALAPLELSGGVTLAIAFVFAPLCEELARWIALRWMLDARAEPSRGHRDALSFGIGHGGAELAILMGISGMSLGAWFTGALPPEAAQAIEQAGDMPWWMLLAGPLERAVALTTHLAMSWLVWRSVREGTWRWLGASIALHYTLNATIVGSASELGPEAGVAACLLIAPLPIALLLWAKRSEPPTPRPTTGEPDTSMAISCRGLGKSFEGTTAIGALELDVKRGELFALLGPNGAGKTTLVRILAGLIPPSRGRASVMGYELGRHDDAIRGRIGVLTEAPGLYDALSTEVNLRLFGRLSGLEEPELGARIERLLRRFELWERRGDAVGSFSKGMRQKVSLARVLLTEPPLLFLDEPTSGLDPSAAEEVRALVRELKRDGRTIVLTTHRLAEAEELADRVGILRTDMLALDTVSGLRRRLYGQRARVRCLVPAGQTMEEVRAQLEAAARSVDAELCAEDVASDPSYAEIVVKVSEPDAQLPALARAVVAEGLSLRAIADVEESLEDVYLDVIGRAR